MKLITALISGLLLYLLLHLGALRQPLTIGYIKEAYDFKTAYASTIDNTPKIVVIGGSSSLFSVRCQILTEVTGEPCVNMAVTAGLGIDLILAKARPVIEPGDTVILPLEYDFYTTDAQDMRLNATANTYLATYDHALLWQQDWRRIGNALMSLPFLDIYASLVEMGLKAHGFKRRFTLEQLTPNGDMQGHSPHLATDYEDYLKGLQPPIPEVHPSTGLSLIESFIHDQRNRHVHVYGTNPTIIDDGTPASPGFAAVEQVWLKAGAGFLKLPTLGRYPRAYFYDTGYHLSEPHQMEHTRALAQLLLKSER